MKPKRGSAKEAKSIQHKKRWICPAMVPTGKGGWELSPGGYWTDETPVDTIGDKFSDFLESQGHEVVDVTPVSSKDWEKGLRKASKGEVPEDTYDDIESYVHSLLNSQRQEIIEKIENMKKISHVWDLDDLLSILKEKV